MTDVLISKTDFIETIDAPLHLWALKRGGYERPSPSVHHLHLFEVGKEFERLAIEFVISGGKEGKFLVQEHMVSAPFHAYIDLLQFDPESKAYDVFEVKATREPKAEHIRDAAFQYILCKLNIEVRNVYIIHMNKLYRKAGDLNIGELIQITDVTDKVLQFEEQVKENMQVAESVLSKQTHEGLEPCHKPSECVCPNLCFPDIAPYSIFELPGLRRKKANAFRALGYLEITDVPDSELTNKQVNQKEAIQYSKPIIQFDKLKSELTHLTFPISFLDYETYNPGIPLIDNYSPNQPIVFQYSLHVADVEGGQIIHKEYLAKDINHVGDALLNNLKKDLPTSGSILVWSKAFEMSRNREMAESHPSYSSFLEDINNRIYDLADPFRKGLYIHKDFGGRYSIKNVHPVLSGTNGYRGLEIASGDVAMVEWWKMVNNINEIEQDITYQHLLAYCKLDTLAMVEIWKYLNLVQIN